MPRQLMVDELDARWGDEICTFWDVDDKGKGFKCQQV